MPGLGLRIAAVSTFMVLIAVACGGTQSGARSSSRQNAGAEMCPITITPSTAPCPTVEVPPGEGSGGQCSSDADCKGSYGTDGRCIKNPVFGALDLDLPSPRLAGNLLAGPPAPPSRSICVFDTCHADSECAGGKMKCVCGTGRGDNRNHCKPLDMCRSDKDCKADNVCMCGTNGNSNYCVEGDCHTDADCDDGFKCEQSHCHSKKDKCQSQADCPASSDGPRVCRWGREDRRWACHVMPPIPPG